MTDYSLDELDRLHAAATPGKGGHWQARTEFKYAVYAAYPALAADLRRLREALSFYADSGNYEWDFPGQTLEPNGIPVSNVDADDGQTARLSLFPADEEAKP